MDFTSAANLAVAITAGFVAARLLQFGLGARCRGLLVQQAFYSLVSLALALVPLNSPAYFWTYLISTPVSWFTATWAVRDLIGLVFADYPGVYTMGRWITYGVAVLSAVVSLLVVRESWAGGAGGRSRLYYFHIADLAIFMGLALVILLVMLFLSRMPLKLRINSWISVAFFSTALLSMAAARLVDSLDPFLAQQPVDLGLSFVESLSYLIWGLALRHERAQAPAKALFHRPNEEQLFRQLNALNSVLRGAGRG